MMPNYRIMVVEDEAIVALEIERRLNTLGYFVSAIASSGSEAIQEAATSQPDLILMDIKLKGNMDGIEAAEQIRRQLNIPIVYLTAYADDSAFQRAKSTKPFGYLVKPFQERDLYITIEIALDKHRLEQQLKAQIGQLQHSLDDIKTLKGVIPICSSCKKIRDDQGRWQQLEVYIRDHTGADFTHSLCPDCAYTLYPELFEEKGL
jgi:CheY-like chemotaxis protein